MPGGEGDGRRVADGAVVVLLRLGEVVAELDPGAAETLGRALVDEAELARRLES